MLDTSGAKKGRKSIGKAEWEAKKKMLGNKCIICGKTDKQVGGLVKAHIKAHSKGGSQLVPMCAICHKKYDNGLLSATQLKSIGLTKEAYKKLMPTKKTKMEKSGLRPIEKAALQMVDKWNNKAVIFADTGRVRRFCCLVFRAQVLVKTCNATLELINIPDNAEKFHSLHWSGDPYTYQAFAEPKDIKAGALARLDVIFTTADGEEAISQGASGPAMQPEISDRATGFEGAWIATPISLSWPLVNNQNYLPPGEYQAKLVIVSEEGSLFTKDLTIKSPTREEELEIEI